MGHIPSSPYLDSLEVFTQQNTTLGILTMKNLYDGIGSNTAMGYQSLRDVEDGDYNVSIGNLTLSGTEVMGMWLLVVKHVFL